MTFETSKALKLRNIEVALRYPSSLASLILGGKARAFQSILSKILSELSQHNESEISSLLKMTTEKRVLVMPKELAIFNGSRDLTNIVVLYYLVRCNRPQIVVETGVWTGKTSWGILQALRDNGKGRLISIDLGITDLGTSKLPVKTIGGMVPHSLRDIWKLLIGNSKETLPALLNQINGCDMFYHDSDHSYEHMLFEFNTAFEHLREGGILASDDVTLNQAFNEVSSRLNSPVVIGDRLGFGFKKLSATNLSARET